ncbi:MAG: cysteine desulfurase NifS [Roseburia sp.]|nr:cysteine desulfurase NifS [Roseburia sp.]MCM1099371.1 cysteine desulfurase NifS [Ruminococcus flavefaciens]
MRMIYLDHAATTRPAPEVVEAMLPYLTEYYGNPSAIYSAGATAKKAVNQARRTLAEAIGAGREEIFFTSGGTESDNWAIRCAAEAYREKGKHIITTKIEHHAVLHTCQALERSGFEVTYLDVDEDGLVNPGAVREAIRPDTILISVMTANNEVGTIEPIGEIGSIARERGILFHTDAVQAFGQIPLQVKELQVDLLSASAHKLNGPKGVGFLYVRAGLRFPAFHQGGAQERGRRAGTEDVPGIVGFEAAAKRAFGRLEEKREREIRLRDYLIERIEREIPDCRLNGHRTRRLPGNVNFSFSAVEGESVLILLDMKGICASGGSACTSGAVDPSHVLQAMGRSPEETKGAIRMTLAEENTFEELDQTMDCLKEILGKLRSVHGMKIF